MDQDVSVWAVVHPTSLPELLYDAALALLDPPSRDRVKRFYHRADSCRCLIGRVLPRALIARRGVSPEAIVIGATATNKPYFVQTTQDTPPVAFNVSHDNELVALAFAPGDDDGAPAYRVGVDVMRVQPPRREAFPAFVETVGDTLTPNEKRALLAPDLLLPAALRRFYLVWTTKEAYTKALGIGLGFDFRRVEVDIDGDGDGDRQVRGVSVDGAPPLGWEFLTFEVALSGERNGEKQDVYVGVVARYVGGETCSVRRLPEKQLVKTDATTFLRDAVRELGR